MADGTPSSGVVKWFDPNKGYGFIQLSNKMADVFMHVKELRKCGIIALNDGDQVLFSIHEGHKGFYATDIKKC